uniref:Uncharacterized protein n=1 Tax=Steinernema glaseri TaxID=37863 RepID=A0A1I8A1B9_9BILA
MTMSAANSRVSADCLARAARLVVGGVPSDPTHHSDATVSHESHRSAATISGPASDLLTASDFGSTAGATDCFGKYKGAQFLMQSVYLQSAFSCVPTRSEFLHRLIVLKMNRTQTVLDFEDKTLLDYPTINPALIVQGGYEIWNSKENAKLLFKGILEVIKGIGVPDPIVAIVRSAGSLAGLRR